MRSINLVASVRTGHALGQNEGLLSVNKMQSVTLTKVQPETKA